jgi:hypothetical protein
MEAAPPSPVAPAVAASSGVAVFSRFALPECPRSDFSPAIGAEPTHRIDRPSADPALALIAPYVDAAYYLAGFPDGAAAARDPVAHFHQHGWRQGRDPAPWFDTSYYLAANDDVREAGIDPLLHYLRNGRAEGRAPRPPGGSRRRLVDVAMPPARRRPGHDAPPGLPSLDTPGLVAALRAACLGRRGLVVSVSHDRYIDKTGGVQIFIDDEEAQFAGDRFAYLHLAPIKALLTLAPDCGHPTPLQLVLGGRTIGIALEDEVIAALGALPPELTAIRLFIVHSIFGHRTETLAALATAFAPQRSFFWIHDYASLCSGYNLLRNDAAFCRAPAEDSMACRICVYGEDRAAYRRRIRALFGAVAFDVLAPSAAALAVWHRGADGLPHRSARVHANAVLRPTALEQAADGPIRVAFVGFPTPAKGWPLFAELVMRGRASGRLAFFHFANASARQPLERLRHVTTQVDRNDRLAMANALAEHAIDLVAVLSPWPETFSFVTHEALAAGADVVALADGGGVTDAIMAQDRGVVLRSEADVLHFFLDGPAEAYVRAQRAAGRQRAQLIACGTTATFDPAAPDEPVPERLATAEPDLVVVAAGTVLLPEPDGERLVFSLPEAAGIVRLVSRHLTPARLAPESGDHRRMGVAVRRLWLDGEATKPGDRRRRRGWHGAASDACVQWTSGDALLDAGTARRLAVELAPLLTYRRCPLGGGA